MKISRFFYLSLFSFALIYFSSCKDDEPVPPPVRTYQDVQVDFKAIDLSAGIHDETLAFLGGNTWSFRVIAPEIIGNETYPLILDLHGASGGAADAHQKTACYVEPAFDGQNVFILSPNGGPDLWTSFRNQEMVINLMLLAKEYWPIDDAKIAVTGYSNGGNGSWFFGETQSADFFSAAIPMASSYNTTGSNGLPRIMPIPMYVIHGGKDELFPLSETQNWVNQTVSEGSDVTLVVADSLGHYEPCSYVPYLKDAVTWLMDDVWK